MLTGLWVPEFVTKFSNLREAKIHSWSDYVSCAYTVMVFLICCALSSYVLNFKKSPMHCMAPANYPGDWVSYVTDYCFVQSTYQVTDLNVMYQLDQEIPFEQYVSYYQWVPSVLFIMTFLFFIPKIFWAFTLMHVGGINLDTVVKKAEKVASDCSEKRKENLEDFAHFVKKQIALAYENRLFNFFPSIIICRIISKWLYVLIALFQISILMVFVGIHNPFWGYQTVIDSINAAKWVNIEQFPYVTFCNLQRVADFANENIEVVQCLLVMNMLNDKILVFLSIWMTIVALISFLAACHTTFVYIKAMFLPSLADIMPGVPNDHRLANFLANHVHLEGIFLFDVLKDRISPFFAHEVVTIMFTKESDSEMHGLAWSKDE